MTHDNSVSMEIVTDRCEMDWLGIVVFSLNLKAGLSLDRSCEAHTVVGAVVHRVVLPEEYISQNPQGLSILRGQVGGGDANTAAIAVLGQKNTKDHRKSRQLEEHMENRPLQGL